MVAAEFICSSKTEPLKVIFDTIGRFFGVIRTYFSLTSKVILLRWPEPIYMGVGYAFKSLFSAGTI